MANSKKTNSQFLIQRVTFSKVMQNNVKNLKKKNGAVLVELEKDANMLLKMKKF